MTNAISAVAGGNEPGAGRRQDEVNLVLRQKDSGVGVGVGVGVGERGRESLNVFIWEKEEAAADLSRLS